MTGFSSSKDNLLASLKSYTVHLAAQNEALQQLSSTTSEMRSALGKEGAPDISAALNRREQQIARYVELCSSSRADEALVEEALAATEMPNDELNSAAKSVIALREDMLSLTQQIVMCQNDCETLLRTRLESTSEEIQKSARRRKLDAVYGPAISHESPSFMDKQQ